MTGPHAQPDVPADQAAAAASGPLAGPPQPLPPQPYFPPPRREPGPFSRGFGLGAGAGLGAGVALLVITLVGSVISTLMLLGFAGAAAGLGAGAETQTTLWGNATAKKKIQAIDISGVIQTDGSSGLALTAGTYGYEIAQRFDRLRATDADAVVLIMNTPGGAPAGASAMADAIERYQQRTGKKVFAFVQDQAASAGVYTMAGVDEIVAGKSSLIGAIGVISGPFLQYNDVVATSGTLLESGVTTRGGITGGYMSAGKNKDFGSPWRPMNESERVGWQAVLDNEYATFVSWVSKGRDIPEATIREQLGASIFDAGTAQKLGLVDAVMNRDEAFRHFAEVAGLDPNDTRVVVPAAPTLAARLLGAEARVLGHAPAAQPVAGQPARATASFCSSLVPMAYHGSLASLCG